MSKIGMNLLSAAIGAIVASSAIFGGKMVFENHSQDIVKEIIDTNEFSDVSNITVSDKGKALVLKTDQGKTFYAIYNDGMFASSATKVVAGDGYLINEGRLIPYITDEDGTRYTLPSYSGDATEEVESLKSQIAQMEKDAEHMAIVRDKELEALKEAKASSDEARKKLQEKVSNLLDNIENGGATSVVATQEKQPSTTSISRSSQRDDNSIAGAKKTDVNPFSSIENGEIRTSKDRIYQQIPEEDREKIKNEILEPANMSYKKRALSIISEKIAPLSIEFPSHTKESKGQITVFTDPSCPYCNKLHNDMEKIRMKGYDVRYFPIPKDGMSSPITIQLAQVMCAPKESQADAINNVFSDNHYYDSNASGASIESCKTRVESNFNTAIKLEASKTPFAFSNLGEVSEGYSNIDTFMKNLGFEE